MKQNIICVRIAQRVITPGDPHGYTHFPFDRVYLGKTHLTPQFKQLFRYYLSMPLDQKLLDALNLLQVHTEKHTPVRRDDAKSAEQTIDGKKAFLSKIESPKDWLMIVPTHVKAKYKKTEGSYKATHESSELGYILSKAITPGYNRSVVMPQITLHTPKRTIPILCGVCKNNLELHAGNCMPGRATCKEQAGVSLKPDTHNQDMTNNSLEETGADQ